MGSYEVAASVAHDCVKCGATHHFDWGNKLCYTCMAQKKKKMIADQIAESMEESIIPDKEPKKTNWQLHSSSRCSFCIHNVSHTMPDHYLEITRYDKLIQLVEAKGTCIDVRPFMKSDHFMVQERHSLSPKMKYYGYNGKPLDPQPGHKDMTVYPVEELDNRWMSLDQWKKQYTAYSMVSSNSFMHYTGTGT